MGCAANDEKSCDSGDSEGSKPVGVIKGPSALGTQGAIEVFLLDEAP